MKGGDASNAYVYNPAVTSDTGNHAPANASGKWAGLSHLVFCYTKPEPPKPGTIIVEKQTIPDGYKPPLGPFVFTGAISTALGDGESAVSVQVDPGTYTVTEAFRSFWDVGIVCDDSDSLGDSATRTATYKVASGETVRCVFTNTKRNLIIVKKVTDPAGAEQSFGFTASYDQDGFSLADGQQNVSTCSRPGRTR